LCSKYYFNYFIILCKNKLAKILKKVNIKFKIHNVSNLKLAILQKENNSNILDNNSNNSSKLKNLVFLIRIAI